MSDYINKNKVLGELFELKVIMNDYKLRKDFHRKSPATKDVHRMIEESLAACAEAVRNGHPLMFEINIWEQLSLTGWAINAYHDDGTFDIE